jgi:hypothetical protein
MDKSIDQTFLPTQAPAATEPIIYFLVLSSVVLHGMSIPFFHLTQFVTATIERVSTRGSDSTWSVASRIRSQSGVRPEQMPTKSPWDGVPAWMLHIRQSNVLDGATTVANSEERIDNTPKPVTASKKITASSSGDKLTKSPPSAPEMTERSISNSSFKASLILSRVPSRSADVEAGRPDKADEDDDDEEIADIDGHHFKIVSKGAALDPKKEYGRIIKEEHRPGGEPTKNCVGMLVELPAGIEWEE